MKSNKDKWKFYNLPNRNCLSAAEVHYWKSAFAKILKIGMEFEFNLQEKKNGSCEGNNDSCPCINISEESCWKECISSSCKTDKSMELCENHTDICEEADCANCFHFKRPCSGIFCPSFVSACVACDDYKTNCSKCSYMYDPARDPDNVRKQLHQDLQPNNTYGQVAESGVHSIKTDGSLLGKKGAEIITVGRRVDYWEFYKMASNIIAKATSRGAYMNERCSIHMHALASYYGKLMDSQEMHSIPNKIDEMERNLPEIVLANLHQLVRRYQNAMTWMVSGLEMQNQLTRWEKFRVSVLPISAVIHHMKEVREEVSRNAGGTKYGWINYNQVGFSNEGDINRFHVEFRACDGLESPSAVAAIACMYYALIMKAVEISRFGVVEIGDKSWLEQTTAVKDAMLNNMKSYQDGDRFSDTSNLHRHYDLLTEESLDLVRQLKAILIKIGPAYQVLEKLAERPCSIRRVGGNTWSEIEKDLEVVVNDDDKADILLREIITLNQITECKSEEEWIGCVKEALGEDPDNLHNIPDDMEKLTKAFVNRLKENGELVWSDKIGAPILI